MDLKVKDLWYWTIVCLMMGSAFLCMYLNNGYPFLIITLPFVLLDRAYAVPYLLFVAAIGGSFKTIDTSNNTETVAIALMMPLFIYDYFQNNSKMVPYKLVLLYIIFGVFVVIGWITWGGNSHVKQFVVSLVGKDAIHGVYFKMVIKLFKVIFFFIYLKVLINKDKEFLYRALTLLKDMAPYMTILVMLNMLLFGFVSDNTFGTIHFGEANHGDFSANMNALGIYLYIGVFELKSNWYKRFLNLAAIGCLLYIIMNLASRNGLLTFFIISCFGAMIGLWNRNWGFKLTIAVAAVVAACVAGYLFKDSPTIQRFIYETEEEGGGDRLAYWTAGVESLHEEPVLGLGGDETSSIYAVGRYAPGVLDHVMHNTFLEFAVEYGYLGMTFFIVFVIVIIVHAYRNFMLAMRLDNLLLAAPSISYFVSIFAGFFISRIWETTLWYNMTLVFAVYAVYCLPIENAKKKRKAYLVHGLPDPLTDPALAIPTHL